MSAARPSEAEKSKVLKNRIEGFGNGGAAPPADSRWESGSMGSWLEQAKASVDAMVEAFDETANAFADAVEDTISAIAGDDKEDVQRHNEQLERERRKRQQKAEADARAKQDPTATPAATQKAAPPPPPNANSSSSASPAKPVQAERKLSLEDGERSGVDWPQVVAKICESGNLEEFVLTIRAECKCEAEEAEVGGVIAAELLNAVRNEAILRILHVIQVVIEAELPHARGVLKDRCRVKIQKLQEVALFRSLCAEILQRLAPPQATTNGSSSQAATTNGHAVTADLLGEVEAPPTVVAAVQQAAADTCPACGATFTEQAKFCGKCGAKRPEGQLKNTAGAGAAGAQADLLDVMGPTSQVAPAAAPVAASAPQDLLGFDAPSTSSSSTAQVPLLAPPAASAASQASSGVIDLFAAPPAAQEPAFNPNLFSGAGPFVAAAPAPASATSPQAMGCGFAALGSSAASPNGSSFSALGAGLPLTRTNGGVAPAVPIRPSSEVPNPFGTFGSLNSSSLSAPNGTGKTSMPLSLQSPSQAKGVAPTANKNEIKLDDAFELANLRPVK